MSTVSDGAPRLAEESIDLYRAVRPEELEQIQNTGTFENLQGMAEGKYFATSLEGAKQYAEMAEKAFGDPAYSFVATSIPKSIVTDIMKANVDRGVDAIVVPPEHLPVLKPEIVEPELIDRSTYVNP